MFTPEVIVQGGGVGLAAFAMWIIWKLSSTHISKNTEAMQELKGVIQELRNYFENGRK